MVIGPHFVHRFQNKNVAIEIKTDDFIDMKKPNTDIPGQQIAVIYKTDILLRIFPDLSAQTKTSTVQNKLNCHHWRTHKHKSV